MKQDQKSDVTDYKYLNKSIDTNCGVEKWADFIRLVEIDDRILYRHDKRLRSRESESLKYSIYKNQFGEDQTDKTIKEFDDKIARQENKMVMRMNCLENLIKANNMLKKSILSFVKTTS